MFAMQENPKDQKPKLRWSGIVGEAPKPAAPIASESQTSAGGPTTQAAPGPEAVAFRQALQDVDLTPIMDSPNVPEGVKAAASWLRLAAMWIAAGVLLVLGIVTFLLSFHLTDTALVPLLTGKIARDGWAIAKS